MNATTGPAAEITMRLHAAERLLASARMVGDAADHRFWQRSRDSWVAATVRALQGHVGESALQSFKRAAAAPPGEGSVAEDLPVELEAVRSAMAVLVGMRSQGTGSPGETPSVDRRAETRLGP